MSFLLRAALLVASSLALAGCAKPPPGAVDPFPIGDPRLTPMVEPNEAGVQGCDNEDGGMLLDAGLLDGAAPVRVESWATSDWEGPWIPYSGHVQLDIHHGLGRQPAGVEVWLAFTNPPIRPALAAGDLAQLITIDECHVVVWNNTNGDYFARVVVR